MRRAGSRHSFGRSAASVCVHPRVQLSGGPGRHGGDRRPPTLACASCSPFRQRRGLRGYRRSVRFECPRNPQRPEPHVTSSPARRCTAPIATVSGSHSPATHLGRSATLERAALPREPPRDHALRARRDRPPRGRAGAPPGKGRAGKFCDCPACPDSVLVSTRSLAVSPSNDARHHPIPRSTASPSWTRPCRQPPASAQLSTPRPTTASPRLGDRGSRGPDRAETTRGSRRRTPPTRSRDER